MSATAKGSDVSRKASLSDPGPENKVLLRANPSSNDPPSTDRGNPGRSGTRSISLPSALKPADGRIR